MIKKMYREFAKACLLLNIFRKIVPYSLIVRVIGNTISNVIGVHALSSAIIGLTYRCQCNCVHCSAAVYDKNTQEELSTSKWLGIIDEIYSLGVPRINISGGETLLREDIFEIVKYASKKFIVILESNGQLLSKKNVQCLKESGVACVAVSIDSADALMHDKLRKLKGCFANAVEGIKNLAEFKIPCILSTYVNSSRASIQHLDGIMDLARNLNVMTVRVLPFRPVGIFCFSADDLLSVEDEQLILDRIDPMIAYFKGLPAPKKCGIFCKATFYVSPYGEVQPCPYLPLSFGELKQKTLKEILNKMWKHEIFIPQQDKDCLALNKFFHEKISSDYSKAVNKKSQLPIKL